MAKLAAFAGAPLLYCPSALAWGGLGHEAICELAFRELNDTVPQRVIALIQQDEQFTTFRASCNWADRPRQRATEHFVNVPRDATGLDDQQCPLAEKCVVSAIEHDFAVLASPNATEEEKLAALKFLGHWVGDIHQPLHAASKDDRGGNHIRTQGSSCESLHTLWIAASSRSASGCIRSRSSPNSRPASPTSSGPSGWPATLWTGPMSRSRPAGGRRVLRHGRGHVPVCGRQPRIRRG